MTDTKDAPDMVVYTSEDGFEAAGAWRPRNGPAEYYHTDTIEALQAKLERLESALAPFASAWEEARLALPNGAMLSYYGAIAKYNVDAIDFRKAKDALSEGE